MYTNILFDFDGTIFDTSPGLFHAIRYAAESFGLITGSDESMAVFVGPPLRRAFMEYYGVSAETAAAMSEKFRELYTDVGVYECVPYDGVTQLLQKLRADGKRVIIATGKPTVFAKKILAKFGMTELFDDVLGCELDGTREDKAETMTLLLDRYGKNGSVMVGDRDNDVRAAKVCSIPCIGVRWGFAAYGELENAGAVAVAADPDELYTLLSR